MDHARMQSEQELVAKISSWLEDQPENQQCKMPRGQILTNIADRRQSITANTDGTFIVDENPKAKASRRSANIPQGRPSLALLALIRLCGTWSAKAARTGVSSTGA